MGRAYREHFRAIEHRFGPFTDPLAREYAAGVAAAWIEWRAATEALGAARAQREHGKGRRPGPNAIGRLQRRMGLSWGTYDSSLRRLEDLMKAGRPLAPLSSLVKGDSPP